MGQIKNIKLHIVTDIKAMKIVRGLLVVEVAAVLGSFYVWRSMNRDQTYRRWMRDNYPLVLEGFYKTADLTGYGEVRSVDQQKWSEEE